MKKEEKRIHRKSYQQNRQNRPFDYVILPCPVMWMRSEQAPAPCLVIRLGDPTCHSLPPSPKTPSSPNTCEGRMLRLRLVAGRKKKEGQGVVCVAPAPCKAEPPVNLEGGP